MAKTYKVIMVYPDSHLEELEDVFKSGEQAKAHGNKILAEIPATERYRRHEEEGEFSMRRKIKPYFMIHEFEGKAAKAVFDSRKKRNLI
mgnify:CR=1 FL=1